MRDRYGTVTGRLIFRAGVKPHSYLKQAEVKAWFFSILTEHVRTASGVVERFIANAVIPF